MRFNRLALWPVSFLSVFQIALLFIHINDKISLVTLVYVVVMSGFIIVYWTRQPDFDNAVAQAQNNKNVELF